MVTVLTISKEAFKDIITVLKVKFDKEFKEGFKEYKYSTPIHKK